MAESKPITLPKPEVLLGDFHPLVEQLGCAEGLLTLNEATVRVGLHRLHTVADLGRFLDDYLCRVLVPIEFPLIREAFQRTLRNELRELVALDRHLAKAHHPPGLAEASRRVGRAQLQRLRPLRDQRFVQRYLKALDEAEAQGWHTLVYGMTLAVYSVPLRQGLLHYAQQTLQGFGFSAGAARGFTETACRRVLAGVLDHLARLLERERTDDPQPVLRVE